MGCWWDIRGWFKGWFKVRLGRMREVGSVRGERREKVRGR